MLESKTGVIEESKKQKMYLGGAHTENMFMMWHEPNVKSCLILSLFTTGRQKFGHLLRPFPPSLLTTAFLMTGTVLYTFEMRMHDHNW